MAKLSAHGNEIGRIFFTTSIKAYMADGKVLKNSGFGWKLAGKLKDGLTPEMAYANAIRKQEEFYASRPAALAYKKELHAMTGICNRWKLHSAVQMLGDDYDGVWSEACDGHGDNVHADIDEVANLCRLYAAAVIEQKSMRPETAEA